jgi:hypothetical protein
MKVLGTFLLNRRPLLVTYCNTINTRLTELHYLQLQRYLEFDDFSIS